MQEKTSITVLRETVNVLPTIAKEFLTAKPRHYLESEKKFSKLIRFGLTDLTKEAKTVVQQNGERKV